MDCRVDWYSFTVPLPSGVSGGGGFVWKHIFELSNEFTGGVLNEALSTFDWSVASGHGFYDTRYFIEGQGIAFSVGDVNAHALWEFSGMGCELLRGQKLLYALIERTHERATRCDLAVDMESVTSPAAFVEASTAKRFKTRGSQSSHTGLTEYLGSRKGERMARVYRYFPPHPRAHLLRAEAEYKGDAARIICKELSEASLTAITLAAHEPFGWAHPDWQPGGLEPARLPSMKHDRDGAGTLKWLNDAVVPALKKANREGLIQLARWIADNFQEELDNSLQDDEHPKQDWPDWPLA